MAPLRTMSMLGVGLVGVFLVATLVLVRADDPAASRITWNADIEPIFQARCVSCHKTGGSATLPLVTYDDVRFWTAAIRQQVVSRKMPIWQAARGYGDFANDPSLSPFDIARIAAWADAGGPRGDPAMKPGLRAASAADASPAESVRQKSRDITVPCGNAVLSGRLLAVSPRLELGGDAAMTAYLADGRREIVGWIRDYRPDYPTTYWLRRPLALAAGSRLKVEASGRCSLIITLAR